MGQFELTKDDRGYRWRYVTSQGRTVCECTDAYPDIKECIRSIEEVRSAWNARITHAETGERAEVGK